MNNFEDLSPKYVSDLSVLKSIKSISEKESSYRTMKYCSAVWFLVILCFVCCNGWASFNENLQDVHEPNVGTTISKLFPNKKISWKDVNRTIAFVQNIFERMATRETILGYADIKIEPGTPSHGLFVDSFPEPEATEMMKVSFEAVAASAQITYEYCTAELFHNEECGNKLRQITFWHSPLRDACQRLGRVCTKEDMYHKYRSIDGSCNNFIKGERGQSFTVYGRLLYPDYLGGIREPRRSVTKQALPSARLVSSTLDFNTVVDKKKSLAVLYWGQFIEHDLSHTAMSKMIHTGKPIECCDPDGRTFSPRYEHPFCMPITVPASDSYYGDRDITCMSYVRSVPAVGPDCTMGPMQQMNQATHFMDGSQIYGTTKPKSDHLRNFTKGMFALTHIHNSTFLQISKNPHADCQQRKFNAPCYQAGDKRVNTDPHVTAMYTIWVREHNRIAHQLSELNPQWDDEVVFQEARRIVIAEMQHITYNEWIPAVLGMNLNRDYKPSIDPSVSNEFATAGIRALQSALIGRLSLTEEEKKFTYQHKTIDTLLSEMIKNKYSGRGLYYIGKPRDVLYGFDTLSIDIQRGRDHGLPTYSQYRMYCGLSDVARFEDLDAFMMPKAVEALKKVYRSVEDIDLIVGGLAEKPIKGLFGPTLSCILKDQFERTKGSDRFFFSNKDQPLPFSDSQIKEIKRITFARIICDNSDKIDKIQPRVFEAISKSNLQDLLCKSKQIPRLNLGLWSVERFTYTQVAS